MHDFVKHYKLGHANFHENIHINAGLTNGDIVIKLMYFSFTTLSTVGFGDFNPKSDYERLLCAFIMLFGVAIFSHILSEFTAIIDTLKAVEAEIEDADSLCQFFGLMVHFNEDRPINLKLKRDFEEYFSYRWTQDRNAALSDEVGQNFLEQLDTETQDTLMCGFLFQDFLQTFRLFFRLCKDAKFGLDIDPTTKVKRKYYTWMDSEYRDFMSYLLKNLEPVQLKRG